MDVSSITASPMMSQSVWQRQMQQWWQNFQALENALQSGNLTDAQQAYQTLTQGLPTPSSVASTPSTGTPGASLTEDLTALGNALQSGNLTDAQQAYQKLTQDLQSMQQTQGAHHHHHHHRQGQAVTASNSGTAAVTSPTASGTSGTTINTTV